MRKFLTLTAFSLVLHSTSSAQKLVKNKDYIAGVNALQDHISELAIDKFKLAQNDESLTKADHQKLKLILVEAYLKTEKPALALQILADESLKDHPDLTFWKAISLASSGKYLDSIELLKFVKKSSPYFYEARITLANLYQSIDDLDNAQKLYTELSQSSKPSSEVAAIQLVEVLIKKASDEDLKQASVILNELTPSTSTLTKKKSILKANIQLLEKDYDSTITTLTELLQNPEFIGPTALNTIVTTLADTHYEKGDQISALNIVYDYIEKNKDSEILGSLFNRIGNWLPKDTKLSDSKILKLQEWAGRYTSEPEPSALDPQKLPENTEFSAYAHFYYAAFFSKSDEPTNLSKALEEFDLLRVLYPNHLTHGMSLLETAEIQLRLDLQSDAIETLKNIQTQKTTIAPYTKEQAAFVLGQLLVQKMDYAKAAKIFKSASKTQNRSLAKASTLNAGISLLSAGDIEGFTNHLSTTKSHRLKQHLLLEKSLWLARNKSIDARVPLQLFIKDYPDSPRVNEAQLALAENCVRVLPIDPNLCALMIQDLSASRVEPEQYALFSNVKYLHAMSQKDYPSAINTALQILETDQPEEKKTEFTLLLGQAYYRDGQHNLARQTLTQLKNNPDSTLSQYAIYYSALAARSEGTPQSEKDAIELFQEVAGTKSTIAIEAKLQLADLYNNSINEPKKAHAILTEIYDPKGTSNIQRLIAITLASTLQTMGAEENELYAEAIQIYDNLLAQNDLSPIWHNRIHYRKGFTFEEMNKNQEAVNTYYAVINIDTTVTPITEWRWYYSCGFRAVVMLKELGNPKAAIAVAKKLAKSNGPQAEKATKLARDIEMEFMIWDK